MRKRQVVSLILSAAVVTSLVAGCSSPQEESESTVGQTSEETSTEASDTEEPSTEAESETADPRFWNLADPEEVPDALYHFTFDGDDEGFTVLEQADKTDEDADDPLLAGATYKLVESDYELTYTDTGAVDGSLYMDGYHGLALPVEPLDSDTYTISFWMWAEHLSTFGPTLQFGHNIGANADDGVLPVAWLNLTQTEWGFESAKIFPVAWNRNTAIGVVDKQNNNAPGTLFPWIYAYDSEIHGKKEWVMVTIVAHGNEYTADVDDGQRIGVSYYINGELAAECLDHDGNGDGYGGIAPGLFDSVGEGEKFEFNFGINYWDYCFCGFVDDMYVFDTDLNDGQVASLYLLGDPTVEPVAPEGDENEVEETQPEVEVATEVNSISDPAEIQQTVGATTLDQGFWTAFSDGIELADGETKTVKFVNYSSNANNWNNYVIAFTNTQTTADLAPSSDNYDGYLEYGVMRADAFDWGFKGTDSTITSEYSWDWDNFISIMSVAQVTLKVSRNGSTLSLDAEIIGADGETYTYTASDDAEVNPLTPDDPCYFFFTVDNSYIEILSVE